LPDLLAEPETVGAQSGRLDHHQVDERRLEDRERLLRVARQVHAMAFMLEQRGQNFLLQHVSIECQNGRQRFPFPSR
jgi:hypothetical protein